MPDAGIHRTNGSNEEPALPFEGLVDLLRREGFGTRPDDYMELLRVSQVFGSGDLQQLRYRLAPLVATTEQEQQKFYAIFDQYARETRHTDNEARNIQLKKKKRRTGIIALVSLFVIVAAAFLWKYYFVTPPAPSPFFGITVNGNDAEVALPGDTIVADARDYLAALQKDSANVRISWNAGGEWISGVNNYSFIAPANTGPLPIMMRVETGGTLPDTTLSRNVTICSSIVNELRMENGTELQPGETLIVTSTVRGNAQATNGARWVINDQDTIENTATGLRYRVDTAGTYNINYITASNAGVCTQFTPLSVFVQKSAGSTRLEAGTAGEPIVPSTTYRSWLYALLLLPIGGILITAYRHRKALNKLLQKKQVAEPGKEDRSLKHIDIPLVNKDVELVARETGFNSLFTGMRKKIEDDTLVLDINKSIRAEIMAAGMPTLVFTNRLRQQEFIILIDRTRNSGQQWHLFEYLVKVFVEENIRIERFFYTSFDKFYNEEYKEGISLQRLADLYKNHVLLVFGNGYQWLHPHVAAVDKEKTRLLFEWELRTLITPIPYGEWAAKEEALKKVAVLLPADIQGQLLLVQAIHEKQFDLEATLRALPSHYEIAEWQSQEPSEIKEYLGEEVLFQWLCAVAVYPKLRWEMIVETGKAICEAAGRPELMNFSNLLKLVRIPWMQDGAIPEQTRLKLLKELSVPNEIIARETILRLLNDPALNTEEDFFFQQEKQQQELTNRFVLFAHDRDRYQEYEKEFAAFSNRWKNGKVYDAALLRYLDKQPGDLWETPLQNLSHGNLADVLKSGAKESVRSISGHYKKLYWYNAAALAALALFLIAGKPVAEKIDPSFHLLVKADSSKVQQLNFVFVPDSCTTGQNFTAGLQGLVRTASSTFPLEFSDGRNAKVSAPYSEIAGGAVVELTWDNGAQTADERLMLSRKNELLVNSCAALATNKPRLEINYNDALKADTVRQIADLLSSRFDVIYQLEESLTGPSALMVSNSTAPVEDPMQKQLLSIFNRNIQFQTKTNINDSVSTLNLMFEKIEQWEMVSIPQLPAQLIEIWRGTTNGRLLTINLIDRVAWYSTGDPATYGTYRIEEAYRKENTLRLVLSGSNRFRVVFLQNVRAGRFQFCLLPQVFDNRQAAIDMDIAACTAMETMTEYYPVAAVTRKADDNKVSSSRVLNPRVPSSSLLRIYFPLRPQLLSLASAESNRLINNDRTHAQYTENTVTYYRNRFFTEFKSLTANATRRGEAVRKLLRTQPAAAGSVTVNTFNGTPFDRDYVSVTWEEPSSDYPQENAPVTQQPVQQQTQKETPVEWLFLARLELNQKGFDIRNPDEVLFKQLYGQLSSKEDTRLLIVGYYRTAEDRKEAEYMTNEVARQLERYGISAKLGNNKVTTSVREFTGAGINRVIRSSNSQQQPNPFVDLYGINIAMPASKY